MSSIRLWMCETTEQAGIWLRRINRSGDCQTGLVINRFAFWLCLTNLMQFLNSWWISISFCLVANAIGHCHSVFHNSLALGLWLLRGLKDLLCYNWKTFPVPSGSLWCMFYEHNKFSSSETLKNSPFSEAMFSLFGFFFFSLRLTCCHITCCCRTCCFVRK